MLDWWGYSMRNSKHLEGYGSIKNSVPIERLHPFHDIIYQEAQIQHRTCRQHLTTQQKNFLRFHKGS